MTASFLRNLRFLGSVGWLDERRLSTILWAAAGAAFLHDVAYLVMGFSAPLLADHSYRQTQTAITVFWIRQDGVRLAYETPVFGYPWSVPLEFPLYQWLVAALNLVGIPIDKAGRLVSFAFLVACAWPMAILCRALALRRQTLPVLLSLFFAAPIYAYWSRAVLIETCALFFALLWLALVVRAITSRELNVTTALVAAIIGSIAMLQKATTFPVFGLMGGGCLAVLLLGQIRRRDMPNAVRTFLFANAVCLVPLIAGLAWIAFSDGVKRLNPLADSLTSQAMTQWNYGTWAQRHSIELWMAIERVFRDVFGHGAILAVLAIAYGIVASEKYRLPIVASLIGFFGFFAIFTNLHIVHNYYQVANAVFLAAAAALGLVSLIEARHVAVGLMLFVTIVACQNQFFTERYLWSLRADLTRDDRYQISLRAKERTRPDQALLVLGQDYSSVINYYSERKGIALTTTLPRQLIEDVLRNPSKFLGGMQLGGIVACRPFEFSYEQNDPLIDAFLASQRLLSSAGRCQLFAPTQQ